MRAKEENTIHVQGPGVSSVVESLPCKPGTCEVASSVPGTAPETLDLRISGAIQKRVLSGTRQSSMRESRS